MLVLDAGGALVNLNRAAEALLRVAPGVAPSLAALEPALREVVDRVRAHVVGGKGAYVPRGYEEAVNLEGGDGVRNLLPRATPLYSEEGGISGATLVLQDVSRLMRFDELKNDLVATVAHEFRTPLTSLRMAIHLCAEEVVGPLTPKQADLLLAARQDCERLQGIVDDLLDLSRIQAGRMALAPEPIPPRALLEEVAGQQGGQAESAGVALTVTAADDLPAVAADRERAQLVLSNLLANALRHTPRGGRVELLALPQDDSVRFEVADTGPGVPREYQERIFDKFFRVPGAPAGGVGLGLYVAREIVQAHGGEIGVLSDGPGSRFWFTLPQADAVSGPRAAAGGVGA